MTETNTRSYTINALARALDVIEALAAMGQVGVTDLANQVGQHKNNTFRILATLQDRGFVQQDEGTEKYSLTNRFNSLGENFVLSNRQRLIEMINTLGQEVSGSSVIADSGVGAGDEGTSAHSSTVATTVE